MFRPLGFVGAPPLLVALLSTSCTARPPASAVPIITAITPERAALGDVVGFTHVGKFYIPDGAFGAPRFTGFNYGGTAVGYNPVRHSLFMAGHEQHKLVAEVSIPELDETATVLQRFTDPLAGRISTINPHDPNTKTIGGTLPWGNSLIVSAYSNYDGAGTQLLSHFQRPLDLAVAEIKGPLRIGPLGAGFYSGYMGVVPKEWQERLGGPAVTGNGGIGIISRSSFGPALFAFDPDKMGTGVDAQPLVYYPASNPTLGPWQGANQLYGGSDTVRGVAIVPGTSTALIFGRHGDTFCYGQGTTDEDLVRSTANNTDNKKFCFDPLDRPQGVHGYPYSAYAWAYNLNELASVHSGKLWPWQVKPYAVFRLPEMGPKIGGATLDPATGRIYVSEMFGNGTLPVVHVLTVITTGVQSTTQPAQR